MSDERIAHMLTDANAGAAFSRKWEQRFQFAKRGPALIRRVPKGGAPVVGVGGGGAGILAEKPVVGGAAAIATGVFAWLRDLSASSDWDQRHLYHQRRRQEYESIAADIDHRTASNRAITERQIARWKRQLDLLRDWIYEDPKTWLTEP